MLIGSPLKEVAERPTATASEADEEPAVTLMQLLALAGTATVAAYYAVAYVGTALLSGYFGVALGKLA